LQFQICKQASKQEVLLRETVSREKNGD